MLLKSILVSLALVPAAFTQNGDFFQVTEDFGPNPTNVGFWLYIPPGVGAGAPLVVNPHWCGGNAAAVFRGSGIPFMAETYKYMMIFPQTEPSRTCWDLSSPETLKHDAGGDSLGIASMVRYTINKYKVNPNRVFSFGTSSGAMMTNVLLGSYPDLFAAGSAWAGVPFGCYSDVGGTANWSNACATGQIRHTGAEWKTIVQAAYPGYTGWRPKMQSVHGSADEVVNQQNLEEQIKQWTAVLGQSTTPLQTLTNTPNPNWTTYIFGDKFQAINATGVSHNIQTVTDTVLDFFDLKCQGTNCFGRPSSGSTTSAVTRTTTAGVSSRTSTTLQTTVRTTTTAVRTTTTTTRAAVSTTISASRTTTTTAGGNGGVQQKWGQCGGLGYTGPTTCVAGSTCTVSNDWYSQCL